jgi:galactokinase
MDRNELIEEACRGFTQKFGRDPEAVGIAPGRVELLGNHTDYNEGFVLTCAISPAIVIAGGARETPEARVASNDKPEIAVFDPSAPTRDAAVGWSDYVKGVVDELNQAGATVGGFDALIASSLPSGAGVSSSAALEVSAAELLLTLYPHRLIVDAMALAQLCRRAENNFVGAPVGILDQFSSLFGRKGHALFLDCRTLEHHTLRLPTDRAHILIADSGVKHDLANGGGYRERRAQCEAAAAWFAARYPDVHVRALRDVTPEMLEASEGGLDPILAKRARHIVYENKRVLIAAEALQAGNVAAFGEMMTNSHESIRRFFENSAEEVDTLVEIAQSQHGVYGAKLCGGGWGGSAVILHEPDVTADLMAALTDGYRARHGRDVHLLPTVAADGAEAQRFE